MQCNDKRIHFGYVIVCCIFAALRQLMDTLFAVLLEMQAQFSVLQYVRISILLIRITRQQHSDSTPLSPVAILVAYVTLTLFYYCLFKYWDLHNYGGRLAGKHWS